jgi:hypothetical protein
MRCAASSSRHIALLFPPESGFTLRFALFFAFFWRAQVYAPQSTKVIRSHSLNHHLPLLMASLLAPAFIVLWR